MPEITRDDARKLVGRFSEFAAPPAMNEGLSQTIDTLIASARSMSHAKRIVDAILESPGGGDRPGEHPRWPTSERVRKVAWDLLTDSEKTLKCDRCNGLGFIRGTKLIGGVEYEGQTPCSCRPSPPVGDSGAKRASKPTHVGELAERYR